MILEKSLEILEHTPLCDYCLGRQFAQLGSGTTNQARGASIKECLMLEADEKIKEKEDASDMKILAKSFEKANEALKRRGYQEIQKQKCYLCNEFFQNIEYFAKKAIEASEDLRFDRFLFGTKLDSSLNKREERFWARHGAKYSESIKSEINREIGKIIEEKTNKEVDFKNPEIVYQLDTEEQKIEINIHPFYVYGRYRKLRRDLPQTEWFCPVCEGEGCMRCDGTGHLYETSVEQIISKPLLEQTRGDKTVFHGSGREDVDVKMLGNGRPFVIEVKNPKNRKIDLEKLKESINTAENGVEVRDLEITDKEKVKEIKQAKTPKTYRVKIDTEKNKEEIKEALKNLEQTVIKQKTPKRISRKPEKLRKRKVLGTKLEKFKNKEVNIEIKTEAGLYVKELISGDGGRTEPSLSSILNEEVECKQLDVLNVEYWFFPINIYELRYLN